MSEEIRIILKNGEPHSISDFNAQETINILLKSVDRLTKCLQANTLEPCPFCGAETSIDDIHIADVSSSTLIIGGLKNLETYNMLYQVVCSHCGASGATQSSKARAAEHWNARKGNTDED